MTRDWWQQLEGLSFEGTNGSYTLGELRGIGGFGAVFVATSRCDPNPIAVKLIVPGADNFDAQLRELFRGLQIRHPALVNCLDCGTATLPQSRFLYIAMELAGGTLEDILVDQTLPSGEALRIALNVARGLAYLHRERKLVHRDLKPGNVLWIAGEWKLADYGVARTVDTRSAARTSRVVGTVDYMPPESFDGFVSPAWDIWAFGVLMMQALTGRKPFSGGTPTEVMRQIVMSEPDFSTLSEPWLGIIRACLQRHPSQRLTADQLELQLLTKVCPASPEPVTAPPVPQASAIIVTPSAPVATRPSVPSTSEPMDIEPPGAPAAPEVPGAPKPVRRFNRRLLWVAVLALFAIPGAYVSYQLIRWPFPWDDRDRLPDAFAHFTVQLIRRPVPWRVSRAESVRRLGEYAYVQSKDYPLAIRYFDRALELADPQYQPLLIEIMGDRAFAKMMSDDCIGAISDYTFVLEREEDGQRYRFRGQCYEKTGDVEKALKDYANAVRVDPDWVNLCSMVFMLERLGREADALPALDQLLQANPNAAWVKEKRDKIAAQLPPPKRTHPPSP